MSMTTMNCACTVKEVVSYHFNKSSDLFMCMSGASKALAFVSLVLFSIY